MDLLQGKILRAPTEAPLPRSVSWFAPWRWKRRVLLALVLLLPCYVLSPIVAVPMLHRCPYFLQQAGFCVFVITYWPVTDFAKGSKSIDAFYKESIDEVENVLVQLGWPRR